MATTLKTLFAPQLCIPGGVSDLSFYEMHLAPLNNNDGAMMMEQCMLPSFP